MGRYAPRAIQRGALVGSKLRLGSRFLTMFLSHRLLLVMRCVGRVAVRVVAVQTAVQRVRVRLSGEHLGVLGRRLHGSEQDDVISVRTLLQTVR